ncbi:2-acylglycerol O-acyltransferase 2 [Chaetoceros tenuissimus]|uniref:Acyltransferase n=1 Tax=Chaetoceros tenuissimus TaxID=426638 RepID=A0AAD3CYA5_9STRA|nr:2-acylglycerol O-acyltransferase 2 [Chaetoceros tenuissimus]
MSSECSRLRWLAGMFAASIFTLTYIFAPIYVFTAILALLCRYPSGNSSAIYAIPLIVSILTPPMAVPWLMDWLSPMLDYFQFEAITEEKEKLRERMDNGKNYIFCAQPHGVISLCGMCSAVDNEPKYRVIKTAVASVVLSFPILKNVMGLFSLTDASSSNLRKILKRPGIEGSIVLYIGGMAELFKCCREEERLYLSQRKGFIKLALREGIDIVPIYLFGNTSVLSVLKHGPLAKISRRLKLSTTIFWGKFMLPIPRDDKLLYVAGKAISIPKIAEPSQEDIDKYHKIYVGEVERIFNTYKSRAGPLYKDKKLFID